MWEYSWFPSFPVSVLRFDLYLRTQANYSPSGGRSNIPRSQEDCKNDKLAIFQKLLFLIFTPNFWKRFALFCLLFYNQYLTTTILFVTKNYLDGFLWKVVDLFLHDKQLKKTKEKKQSKKIKVFYFYFHSTVWTETFNIKLFPRI